VEDFMNSSRLSRRHLLQVSAIGLAATATPFGKIAAQEASPGPSPVAASGAWSFYGADLTGSRALASDLDSSTVAGLNPAWSVEIGGPVSATPVIADGVAFVGSYDGNLYAVDLASGSSVWAYATGAAVQEPNLGIPLGITGSAAVADGVVYVGDAAATVHAIDSVSGQAIWTVKVDDQVSACIWSSPVIWNGAVYVGVASVAKEEGFRGSVVALDATTGELLWQVYMVPEGADGAGVFDVPAIDPDRKLVIVGTQNAYTANPAPFGDATSVVALDATLGNVEWVFNAPIEDPKIAPVEDVAFSASPNLFSATIGGETVDLVGIGQKSGVYWALNRETGEVVWKQQISPAGFLGGMEGTAAVANGVIAIPATNWPVFDGPASGLVTAVDAASGSVLWTATEDAPAASPTSISNDVVFHAGLDGVLHAFALADGTELWSWDLDASVSSGIAIDGDTVVLGVGTPQFAEFVKLGNTIRAFSLSAPAATPLASPIAPVNEAPAQPSPSATVAASPSPVAQEGV
jgi:polyvinyl alcohol dehydrogenase (cytochrome)